MKSKKYLILAGMVLVLGFFARVKADDIADLTNVNNLMLNGGLRFGDAQDPAYVTTLSSSTVKGWNVRVPFYNGSGAATVQGSVIIASTTATSSIYGSMAAITSTTTVIGVSDGVYANGAMGFMVIDGYAIVLTTGVVKVGNVIVSSATASGVGYAGATGGTQVVGTQIGKCVTPESGNRCVALISF